ncbi:hypothetical protein T484DRAFT_1833185 [Baffinella frigidus]|nr:hypothetical protein T484DRAFT_1833185 [Cryptophyta sp. CCMP2293]|mmetsp:Transcript_14166/g.32747  ORF Transcript_14166/g.32747 Transcript_14166/m.32747 type:complete len:195 (+) Transcript_14166:207-791(+)
MRRVRVVAVLVFCALAAAHDEEGEWGVFAKLSAQAPRGAGPQGADDWGVFAKIRIAERGVGKGAGALEHPGTPAEERGASHPALGAHGAAPCRGAPTAAALRDAVAEMAGCREARGLALPGALPGVLACLRAALLQEGGRAGIGEGGAWGAHLRTAVAATLVEMGREDLALSKLEIVLGDAETSAHVAAAAEEL